MLRINMIDFNKLASEKSAIRCSYVDAKPYEHICIDNFLTPEGLAQIRRSFNATEPSTSTQSSDYLFAKNKFENNKLEHISSAFARLRSELISEEFQGFLQFVTGLPIFVDPEFTGGGLHQGGKGSFLEMHADFSRHPVKKDWVRELNILLYLNEGYNEEWLGALDMENLHSGDTASIAPVENRLVIMLSKSHTLHGYKAIRFPEGMYRTSVAAYGYVLDDGSNEAGYTSTVWVPENGVKRFFAGFVNKLVPIKQTFFGSRTGERNRKDQE